MTTAVAHINHVDTIRVGSKENVISATGTTDTIVINGISMPIVNNKFDYPFAYDGVTYGLLGTVNSSVSGGGNSVNYSVEKLPPAGMDYVNILSISTLDTAVGSGFTPILAVNEQIVFPTIDNTRVLSDGSIVTDSETVLQMYRIRTNGTWDLFYWVGGKEGKAIFAPKVKDLTVSGGAPIADNVSGNVNIYEADGSYTSVAVSTKNSRVELNELIPSSLGRKASIQLGSIKSGIFDMSDIPPIGDVLKPLKFTPTHIFEGGEGSVGGPITPNVIWGENNTLIQDTRTASGNRGYLFRSELGDEYGFGCGVGFDTPYPKGTTLHCQISLYAPASEMSWNAMPHLKFLRWHTTDANLNNEGYADIYIANEAGDGAGNYGRMKHIHENAANQRWTWIDEKLYHDVWETIEYQITLDEVPVSLGGTARTKLWKKINGKMELILDITDQKTLESATSLCTDLKIVTYWNGGAPGSVTMYVDRIVVHDNPNTLVETDSYGNKIIGGV
jgi:hypothetical protein